ncbi:MAG TPA: hypothetical protein DC017_11840 [Candidatus Wallbacteria bacterium]|nr:hypothetical protein [Candidatus Wallbacteria bacterium]
MAVAESGTPCFWSISFILSAILAMSAPLTMAIARLSTPRPFGAVLAATAIFSAISITALAFMSFSKVTLIFQSPYI